MNMMDEITCSTRKVVLLLLHKLTFKHIFKQFKK